ncbi:hypothetical protein FA15DRAFT_144180 [Coprinopsis marcescibilis]|uniref:Uncharacterized protein n=1 Tax=Coprinopsis marcescibilis TaxID=230819 RepID=A0A5C3KIU0_COPMA|nr:hypothetical protein FA15DRAFT_144180 [Coprinopsis marcescibilis]
MISAFDAVQIVGHVLFPSIISIDSVIGNTCALGLKSRICRVILGNYSTHPPFSCKRSALEIL